MAVRKVLSGYQCLHVSREELTFLSLSLSLRQAHNLGRKHKSCVRDFYAQFEENVVQAIIDTRIREYEARELAIMSGMLPPNAPFSSVMPPHPLAKGVPPALPPGWESGTPPPLPSMQSQAPPAPTPAFLNFPGLPPLPGMFSAPGMNPNMGMPSLMPPGMFPPPQSMQGLPILPPMPPGMQFPPPGMNFPLPPPPGMTFPPPQTYGNRRN